MHRLHFNNCIFLGWCIFFCLPGRQSYTWTCYFTLLVYFFRLWQRGISSYVLWCLSIIQALRRERNEDYIWYFILSLYFIINLPEKWTLGCCTKMMCFLFTPTFFFQKGKDVGRSKCFQVSTNKSFQYYIYEVSVNFHLKRTRSYPFSLSVTTVGVISNEHILCSCK